MGARLADIAAQAGVSEATVSRVLNGKPGVAEATRQAVLTALDVLGYERPARLRQRSAGLVGLIVPELENPIFPAFAQVIESALARQGYTPVLCTQTPGRRRTRTSTRRCCSSAASPGIIFVSRPARRHHHRPRPLPGAAPPRACRSCSSTATREGIDAPFISQRRRAPSMELAVAHLVELGHTRIGLAVGPERFAPALRKIAGFREAMRRRLGLRGRRAAGSSRTLFSVEGGQAAAAALLERGATAVVCGSDLMALGAIRAARAPGPAGARRRLGGRLRRLAARRVHRPAADHRAPGGAGDGRRRRCGPCSTRSPASPRRAPSSCSGPSSSSAGRRGRRRGGPASPPLSLITDVKGFTQA